MESALIARVNRPIIPVLMRITARVVSLLAVLALLGQPLAAVPMIVGEAHGHAGPCCCEGVDGRAGHEAATREVPAPISRCSSCPAPEPADDGDADESPCQPMQCLRCCPSAAVAVLRVPALIEAREIVDIESDVAAQLASHTDRPDVPPPKTR